MTLYQPQQQQHQLLPNISVTLQPLRVRSRHRHEAERPVDVSHRLELIRHLSLPPAAEDVAQLQAEGPGGSHVDFQIVQVGVGVIEFVLRGGDRGEALGGADGAVQGYGR